MTIQPLADCLVLHRIRSQFSAGGVFLGDWEEKDIFHKEIVYGEVLAVGPGKKMDDGGRSTMWDLKAGDKIAFSPNGNHHFDIDGEEVVMIRRNSVVGIVE